MVEKTIEDLKNQIEMIKMQKSQPTYIWRACLEKEFKMPLNMVAIATDYNYDKYRNAHVKAVESIMKIDVPKKKLISDIKDVQPHTLELEKLLQ